MCRELFGAEGLRALEENVARLVVREDVQAGIKGRKSSESDVETVVGIVEVCCYMGALRDDEGVGSATAVEGQACVAGLTRVGL